MRGKERPDHTDILCIVRRGHFPNKIFKPSSQEYKIRFQYSERRTSFVLFQPLPESRKEGLCGSKQWLGLGQECSWGTCVVLLNCFKKGKPLFVLIFVVWSTCSNTGPWIYIHTLKIMPGRHLSSGRLFVLADKTWTLGLWATGYGQQSPMEVPLFDAITPINPTALHLDLCPHGKSRWKSHPDVM